MGKGYHFNIKRAAAGHEDEARTAGMDAGSSGRRPDPENRRANGAGPRGPGSRARRMNVRSRFGAWIALAGAFVLAAAGPFTFAANAQGMAPGETAEAVSGPSAPWKLASEPLAQGGLPGARGSTGEAIEGAQSRPAAGDARSAPGDAAVPDPAGFLRELLEAGLEEPEFLHPDVAFRLAASAPGPGLAVVHWRIEPGYYLYAKRMEVHLPEGAPPGTEISGVELPRGEMQEDPYFGRVEVYRHEASASVRLVHAGPPPRELALDVVYQGCADEGLCYPPIRKAVPVRLDGGGPSGTPADGTGAGAGGGHIAAGAASDVAVRPFATDGSLSETDRIARRLETAGIAGSVAAFFGFGLLLSFTPCIFPMIPILSSILVSGGRRARGRARGLALSAAYVSGSALAWAAVGGVAGLLGANVQIALQSPWAIGAVGAMFVALALAMFGLFTFELPAAWMTRATSWTNRAGRGGGHAGAAAMGVVSTLVVGPCVAAPMAGAVLYIGQVGDAVRGSVALAAMGFGMGMPLLVLGASWERLLPKAGAWMDTAQRVAGVVLLGVAAYLLERVLPPGAAMVGWAVVAASACLVLARSALRPRPAPGGTVPRVSRHASAAGALAAAAYAGVLLVGASIGANDPLRPLAGPGTPADRATGSGHLEFTSIKGLEGPLGLDAALARAEAAGRFVMLDFYADWCVSCKEMEESTFRDPRVLAALGEVSVLRADVTANDADDRALMRRLEILGPPAILFFGPDRLERRRYRTVGFKDAEEFSKRVSGATSAA